MCIEFIAMNIKYDLNHNPTKMPNQCLSFCIGSSLKYQNTAFVIIMLMMGNNFIKANFFTLFSMHKKV